MVWIGGEGCLTTLSAEGWRTFATEGIVRDIAVSGQGSALLAPGLEMCDGRLLRSLLPRAPGGEQDAVTIDPLGRIWVGYYGGIALFDGGRWVSIPLEGANVPAKAKMVRDLASDSRGVLWVATGGGLARYDGSAWRYYSGNADLAAAADCVMVDGRDRIWVGHEKGLSVLQGTSWRHFPLDEIGFVRNLAVGVGGNILAGSLYHGLSLFDGQAWQTWADQTSGLPSNRVTALAADALGRIWVGTHAGLSVYDGSRWITYQEANCGLGDNQVSALAIGGGALTVLPTPAPLRYGRVEGQVSLGRQPVAGVRVVLCSELSLTQGFADRPGEDAAWSCVTRTAADGSYTFEQVPVGHYAVTAEVEPGRWVTRMRVLTAVRYAVRVGQTTRVETIEGAE